ncbi:MAG: UDP-2,3-diacylglucosamine diphosphatase LpxI [Rickettsiales bacterium]|jgi:DUF1009 family protein|nr:UDP-2,3-diacylglucosamine diphosphatase LpxI [Rickettsiales bacterium]
MKKIVASGKIAVVAGALRAPFVVVGDLRRRGFDVFVIGIKNFCDPLLKPDLWARLGQAGGVIKTLRRLGIRDITMTGSLGHPNLADIRPDLSSVFMFARIIKNQKGYDSMLSAFAGEIERLGFRILAPQDLCPSMTFEAAGVWTKAKPGKSDLADIERGIEVSKVIGKMDIGHSVAVHRQVLAMEAAEGTARMLDRVAELRKGYKKKGGVLVKMVKPNQDLRLDTTAIGPDTVNAVADAKLAGIVVDAKHCMVIDKDLVVKTADKRGVFIVSR